MKRLHLSYIPDFSKHFARLALIVSLGWLGLTLPNAGLAAGKPIVYLTFDDGPSHDDVTDRVLETLAYHDIKATFFVLGSRVRMAPHKLQAIVDAGHAVGNHTYSHRALVTLSNSEIRKEFRATAEVVRKVAGIDMHCYRPPFGSFNKRVTSIASAEGLAEMLWTVDTLDWRQNQDRQTIRTSLRRVSNGSVVLLHDGPVNRESTWEALSTWLAEAVHHYEFAIPTACGPVAPRMIHAAMRPDASIREIHYTVNVLPDESSFAASDSDVDEAVRRWQWEQRLGGDVERAIEAAIAEVSEVGAEQPVSTAKPVDKKTEPDTVAPAVDPELEQAELSPAKTESVLPEGPLADVLDKIKRYQAIDLYP